MPIDKKKLTQQAFNLYFLAREESMDKNCYSVRRERLVKIAARAFKRYERRLDL